MKFLKGKYYKALSLYRFMICMGLFILFVAGATLFIMHRVTNKRYEVALKQAMLVLSEAMVYISVLPADGHSVNDIYYWYLIDILNKNFKSLSCSHTDNIACPAKEYRTLNGKAVMSDLIFKAGEDIVIAGKLFRINLPVVPQAPLIITVDTNGGGMQPNKLGYDVFVFQIIDKKLRAMGAAETIYPIENYKFYCNRRSVSKDELLGVNCTYYALTDYNYFKNLKH